MYAAGAPHPYRDACQWVMAQIAAAALKVVIDAEVIQEILHRYGALNRYTDAVNMARDLMTLVPQIVPVDAADMRTAVTLFQQYAPQGVRARDCIHAAVMQNHALTHIISTDTLYQAASQSTP
jgi:predicted nucleic acid-binding protein